MSPRSINPREGQFKACFSLFLFRNFMIFQLLLPETASFRSSSVFLKHWLLFPKVFLPTQATPLFSIFWKRFRMSENLRQNTNFKTFRKNSFLENLSFLLKKIFNLQLTFRGLKTKKKQKHFGCKLSLRNFPSSRKPKGQLVLILIHFKIPFPLNLVAGCLES